MNKNENIYITILNHFTGQDKFRDWLNTPFHALGKAMATDGNKLVAVPLCDLMEDLTDHSEKVWKLWQPANMEVNISIDHLQTVIEQFPRIDCYDMEKKECKACRGNGDVDFEFCYKYDTYRMNGECPVCEGEGLTLQESGKPNGKTELDPAAYFKIGNSYFRANLIMDLLFVATKLNSDIVLINQTEPNKPSIFRVKDVEILLMSTMSQYGIINGGTIW
jgi:hypothetical protein